ncbi:hypothetical protein MUK42_13496 [Musa troglodytarum]|uniref:Uncharacterized protein n=1 Tax=Musa troglodytarum TaxID=320322 RepID=A0A9E7GMB2_9LILI|nr:hypothetical protein MUK42_13496 [Musa troglodytarum]
MPSRDHPLKLRVEEEMQKLKSSVAQSCLSAQIICEGLRALGGLYECIEELLHFPTSTYSNIQEKESAEVELDGSVRLLDLLGIMRDCMMTTKEQIITLEIALRRQGVTVAESKMYTHIRFDKKAEKGIKSIFKLLKIKGKCVDKDCDIPMVGRFSGELNPITTASASSGVIFLDNADREIEDLQVVVSLRCTENDVTWHATGSRGMEMGHVILLSSTYPAKSIMIIIVGQ